jgi:hypothetical protein
MILDSIPRHPKTPDQLWGPLSLLFSRYQRILPHGYSGQGMRLTTHLHLGQRLTTKAAIPPLQLSVFITSTGACPSFLSPYNTFIYCLGKKLITITITNTRCPLYSSKVGHTHSAQYTQWSLCITYVIFCNQQTLPF